MKVVINNCFGGFHPSAKAVQEYLKRKGKESFLYVPSYVSNNILYTKVADDLSEKDLYYIDVFTKDFGKSVTGETLDALDNGAEYYFSHRDIPRNDPDFVAVVEELGVDADTYVSNLKIVEIPDDVEFVIEEYDGLESVAEKHRTWR